MRSGDAWVFMCECVFSVAVLKAIVSTLLNSVWLHIFIACSGVLSTADIVLSHCSSVFS